MADRFVEMICEITGQKSPEEIREEELIKLIDRHLSDYTIDDFSESETGLVYRKIYDDPHGMEHG